MKVLFLSQILPYPLDAGPKIRAYYALRHLSQQHEVTLLSFIRPDDPPEAVEYLRAFCQAVHTVPMHRARARDAWHFLRSLVNGTPFLIARDWVPEMADRIWQMANGKWHLAHRGSLSAISHQPFDVVHADQLWMAQYALLARNPQSEIRNPKLILDQHNAVFQIPRRLAQHEPNPLKRLLLALEWRKLARYEARVCSQFDHVVWVTEEDRQAVMGQIRNPQSAIRNPVIPICIDPSCFNVVDVSAEVHGILSLGGLHWPPNAEGVRWFTRQVWPKVQASVPNATLTIIGKNPPKEIRNPKSEIRNLTVTGYVEDLRPFVAGSAVLIVPLHAAGGMRVKILEAWARGLPIVSTTIGAEGLKVRPGENILIADTPERFAQAVIRLLRDPAYRRQLAVAGRQWVEQHYNWRTVYPKFDEVYEGLSDRATSR